MGILGTTPAPADGLPADAPRGRQAERVLAGEMLQELRTLQATMTSFVAKLSGRITNNVLESGTRTFPAAGVITRDWGSVCGAVEVANLGAHTVTVAAGSANSTTAPTDGPGVFPVPAGAVRLVNVAAREVSFYGTSGEQISIQAFAGGGISGWGLVGVDGGVA